MRNLVYRELCDWRGEFLPWINALRSLSGAYVIRSKSTGQTLYVGESHTGSLAKTIKRHFYPWRDDPERRHNTYDRHGVEVAVRVAPAPSAAAAQNNLIRRLAPRDNGFVPAENPF